MTTVLITGASGYIGKHITLQLLNQGYKVRASVRSLSKSSEVKNAVKPYLLDSSELDSRLTFVELDLEKDSGWDAALLLGIKFIPVEVTLKESAAYLVKNGFIKG